MHELNVIGSIVKNVVNWGMANNVTRVLEVHLTAGELRMFDQDYMNRYFERFTRETIAHGGIIIIDKLPIKYKCSKCGAEFIMTQKEWLDMNNSRKGLRCVECEFPGIDLLSGDECFISDITAEVEDDEEE